MIELDARSAYAYMEHGAIVHRNALGQYHLYEGSELISNVSEKVVSQLVKKNKICGRAIPNAFGHVEFTAR